MSSHEPRNSPAGRATGGTTGAVAPKDQLQVAAFGDSLMWGQGVERKKRFSQLIAVGLGRQHGQTGALSVDRSRSGAAIRVTSGKARDDFVDTFPHLFPDASDAEAFLRGDEQAATRLFGEVPATFPTVEWQVSAVSDAAGKKIDVALVSGGANDGDFENVINPTAHSGLFVEFYEAVIRDITFVEL